MPTKDYSYGPPEDHGTKAIVDIDPDGKKHKVSVCGLHVSVVPDDEGWFAQAFEIDYGVQGSTEDEVKLRFELGLAATIHHNIDIFGDINNMLHPNHDWLLQKVNADQVYDYSCTEMHKVAPKFAAMFPFIYYETQRRAA
jgi:hypothetical protein